MDESKITVREINIMGWGGGPAMTYGISYRGKFEVSMSIGGLLRFEALESGRRECGSEIPVSKGFVFYSAPNTIREMR